MLYQGPEDDFIIRYITDALSIDETNEQEADTVQGMIDYFEAYYETYGRSVELIPYESSGIANDEVAARADAVRIAEDIQPFMVWSGPALTNAFADELAARGVLCLACTPAQPPDWYTERDPFVWSGSTPAATRSRATRPSSSSSNWPASRPSSAATTSVRRSGGSACCTSSPAPTRSRRPTSSSPRSRPAASTSSRPSRTCSTRPRSSRRRHRRSPSSRPPASPPCLLSTDPIAPRDFTREATAQQYFPEWLLAAVTLTDTTAFARTYDQEQWAHAFGVTALAARIVPERSGYYRLYQWYNGEPPPTPDQIGVLAPYPAVFYGVLQDVGPDLTRVTWADALRADIETIPAITQPYLTWGGPDVWPYVDYSGIDDTTLIWWDPTATGPDEIRRDGTGMWQYADGGARFLPGEWPTESHLFDAGSSVTIFENPPPRGGPARLPEPGRLIDAGAADGDERDERASQHDRGAGERDHRPEADPHQARRRPNRTARATATAYTAPVTDSAGPTTRRRHHIATVPVTTSSGINGHARRAIPTGPDSGPCPHAPRSTRTDRNS